MRVQKRKYEYVVNDDSLDYSIFDVDNEFGHWFENTFENDSFTINQMKALINNKEIWNDLQNIFAKYSKLKEVGGLEKLKLPEIKDIKEELLEMATEGGGIDFGRCEKANYFDGCSYYNVGYGAEDDTYMREFSIDVKYETTLIA